MAWSFVSRISSFANYSSRVTHYDLGSITDNKKREPVDDQSPFLICLNRN